MILRALSMSLRGGVGDAAAQARDGFVNGFDVSDFEDAADLDGTVDPYSLSEQDTKDFNASYAVPCPCP